VRRHRQNPHPGDPTRSGQEAKLREPPATLDIREAPGTLVLRTTCGSPPDRDKGRNLGSKGMLAHSSVSKPVKKSEDKTQRNKKIKFFLLRPLFYQPIDI